MKNSTLPSFIHARDRDGLPASPDSER
jgi:hypothetical protein